MATANVGVNFQAALIKLLAERAPRVERICLVDRPVDWPFVEDSLIRFMAKSLPNLQFVYLRELDLEKVNRGTVAELSRHRVLKKLIVHGCRNYDVFQDFHALPQLLVVKGEIVGLKQMLGDFVEFDRLSPSTPSDKGSLGSHGQSERSSSTCNGARVHSASPIAVRDR